MIVQRNGQFMDTDNGETWTELPFTFLRTPYNYDMNAAGKETAVVFKDKSLARQEFKEDADINTIVERFGLTHELPELPVSVPLSGDYTEVVNDYRTALDMVIGAQKAFMELPAGTRARFGNDPQLLMEFVQNKDNLEEARKLGLAVPAAVVPPPAPPMLVKVVPDVDK